MPPITTNPPNIIFIHVDEMRFPMHFPPGIGSAEQFLAKFMPNVHSLWEKGVKFSRYYTAAADCTPGRGTFVTGLYAYQTGLFLTREEAGNPYATEAPQPALHIAFPTYGKLLRSTAGYETPYIGKWHLSNSLPSPDSPGHEKYLEDYGFRGLTLPDPLGMPAQGLGVAKPQHSGGPPPPGDPEIAAQAVQWLYNRANDPSNKPFCLTVGFVNPHDKQFFWGGTQANQFNAVYNTIPDPLSPTGFEIPLMGFNQPVGPPLPPKTYNGPPTNWQSTVDLKTKPQLQTVFKEMFSYCWTGGIDETDTHPHFYAEESPFAKGKHTAFAPHEYWARALDFYTQMMSAVDVHVGQVIHNIPERFRQNTIIVFSADHGEYASSHGLQGKGGTVYEECFNVPLIVVDGNPQSQLVKDIGTVREQLVSSVDLLRMLVTLGNNGSEQWLLNSPYDQLYGGSIRANLCAILGTNAQAGRQYVIYTTDEFFSVQQDYLNAPQHVVGLLMESVPGYNKGKLGYYHDWQHGTTAPNQQIQPQWEYYNYDTDQGRQEMINRKDSAEAQRAEGFLNTAMKDQLNRAMPTKELQDAQDLAIKQYWAFVDQEDKPQTLVSTAFA